jgi:CBS domain containing-hemolysin-like protein
VAGTLEFAVLLLVLVLMTLLATIQTHLEIAEDLRAGTLSIARFLIFSLATGFLVFTPKDQVVAAILALLLPLTWLFQQAVGRKLGRLSVAEKLAARFDAFVTFLSRLFEPLRLRAPEKVEEYEQELIESVEEFSETLVREIMIPRVDIEVVDGDVSLEKALSVFVSSGYSRLPVVGEDVDDIQGVLYLKDIARLVHQDPRLLSSKVAKEACRPAFFVPETKVVSELLQEMQLGRTQIAVISDEYGGVAGIVTIEDLIEELVGDISDEYDREAQEIEQLAEDSYRVSPRITLDELAEHCEIELDDEDVDTVGGLMTKALGHLPKGGEVATAYGLQLTAERVDARRGRILSILVKKIPADE